MSEEKKQCELCEEASTDEHGLDEFNLCAYHGEKIGDIEEVLHDLGLSTVQVYDLLDVIIDKVSGP